MKIREIVPSQELLDGFKLQDGIWIKLFVCKIKDGCLRISFGQMPLTNRDYFHVSLSYCKKLSDVKVIPIRKPSDMECKEVFDQLIEMSKLDLLQDFMEAGTKNMIRHFWSPVT